MFSEKTRNEYLFFPLYSAFYFFLYEKYEYLVKMALRAVHFERILRPTLLYYYTWGGG